VTHFKIRELLGRYCKTVINNEVVLKMPFPRTWSEELIAEWLQLKGYFVEVGVPISSGKRGGRNEADIIGVRLRASKLEIFHIEVGSLPANPIDNAEIVREKFSQQRQNDIKDYCRTKLQVTSNQINYKKLYVSVYASNKTISYLEQHQLPIKRLSDLIKTEIVPTIREWKSNPPHRPQTKGKSITLPEGMWLLYLLDYILE